MRREESSSFCIVSYSELNSFNGILLKKFVQNGVIYIFCLTINGTFFVLLDQVQ